MPNPPLPVIPSDLLALLARLSWRSFKGALDGAGMEIGAFTDATTSAVLALYLDRGETWGLYEGTSLGLGPFLCPRSTADILTRGTLGSDGVLVYQGGRYRVSALYEAGHLVAREIPV